MSHFSFCKMSQCRPTFFIVKHKTAHKYAAKKVLFRYTQRTVQYCKPCDTVVLTNHIYNFSLLFGGESVCSSSTVWFTFSPAKYKYCEHNVFYWYAVLQYTRQIDFVPVLHPEVSNDGSNCEAAEIWLDPLASLPHAQTMVEHMVYHSGPNLIRDDHSPSSFSSSSSFFSLSFSSSSSSLSSSSLSSYSSSPLSPSFLSSSSSSSHSYPSPSLVVDLFKVLHCLPNKTEAQGTFMLQSWLQIAQQTWMFRDLTICVL